MWLTSDTRFGHANIIGYSQRRGRAGPGDRAVAAVEKPGLRAGSSRTERCVASAGRNCDAHRVLLQPSGGSAAAESEAGLESRAAERGPGIIVLVLPVVVVLADDGDDEVLGRRSRRRPRPAACVLAPEPVLLVAFPDAAEPGYEHED